MFLLNVKQIELVMTREPLDLDGIKTNLSTWIALTKQGKYSVRELQLLVDSYYLGIQESRSMAELVPVLKIFSNVRHCISTLIDEPLCFTELFNAEQFDLEAEKLHLAERIQRELDTVTVLHTAAL